MELQGDGGYTNMQFTQNDDQLTVNRTLEAGQLSIMVVE